jgi:ketosteroid isomerase-like protein
MPETDPDATTDADPDAAVPDTAAVNSPGPREVLARYQRAMLDWSADDLADLYAVDAVHEFPFLFPGMPERYQGREEVRAGYRAAWGASPARPREIRDVVVHDSTDPEVIAVEQVVTGTVTTTGRAFSIPGLLVIRVRGGLITHVRDYMDGLGVAHAMGRLPAVVAGLSE